MKPRYGEMFTGAMAILLLLLVLGVPVFGQSLITRLSRAGGVAMRGQTTAAAL